MTRKQDKLAIAPLSGEVSDGRLSELLARGYQLGYAIQIVLQERYEKRLMREFFKPEAFLPGAEPTLPMVDIEPRGT